MKYSLLLALCLCCVVTFAQDLVITGQSVPAGYEQYAEFKPTVTVKNNGIVAASGFLGVAWYLSSDNVLDGFDYNVGYGSSGEQLAPGASVEISPDMVTIIYQGSNYLIAKADNSGYIAETDENNNTWATSNFVVNPTHVDFTFTQFSVPAIPYPIGGMIKPGYQLKNIGSTDAGGDVFVRFLLSKDAVYDENDIDVTTSSWIHQLTGRPDEFSSSEYLALVVPQITPGDYFLLAVADANGGYNNQSFNETDETNNVSAQPVQIVASDFDIEVTNFVFTQYDPASGLVSGEVGLRNNGTTGVTGYTVSAQLVKAGEAISYPFQEHSDGNVLGKYIAPGEQIWLRVQVPLDPMPEPGTYYAAVGVNLSMSSYIPEAERQNNALMDDTRPVYIDAQPRPHVKLKEVSVPVPVDEADLSIRVAVTMMNTGYITSFDNRYNITVFDAQDDQVHGETVVDKVDFQPGETVTREVSIAPYQPLPAGVYKIVLTCFDPCDTDAEPVTGYFPVVPMTYRLSGLVQGEDGVPINKGKLFLYRKESNGQIRFTQKTDPFQGPTFSFNIDTDPYTLYFIPDPVQYPGYAPTIYGKTVTLESSNFFTTTQDKDVVMEVLKLQPLASGAGVISGRLASGEQSSGRQPASVEAAGVPVMLLSSTGEVVAITYTDASGNFEFTNLPRDNYQILAAFELDATVQMEPYAVDIVTKNARVDLVQTPDGIEPEVSPLILPQILTFNVFATHRYGDAAITLDAQTDARLPITYSSSDERVATIMDGKAVIHSAGEVTISASQAGDDFYHPATTITRPLTIHKGLQSITFEAPAYLLSVASSFTLQAAASSGLPISFESSDESIVSIKGNSATAYKDGVVTITARQPGNPNYEAAADVAHEWIVQVTTAIEPGMEGKKLYPNPTTGIVFIDMPGVRQVEVSDVTGRVQNQASWQGQTLDLSLTPAGLYTIKLTLSNRTVVTKVFKR